MPEYRFTAMTMRAELRKRLDELWRLEEAVIGIHYRSTQNYLEVLIDIRRNQLVENAKKNKKDIDKLLLETAKEAAGFFDAAKKE